MIQDIPMYEWHCLKLHLQVKRTRIMMAVPPNNDSDSAASCSPLVVGDNLSNSAKCQDQLIEGQQRTTFKKI